MSGKSQALKQQSLQRSAFRQRQFTARLPALLLLTLWGIAGCHSKRAQDQLGQAQESGITSGNAQANTDAVATDDSENGVSRNTVSKQWNEAVESIENGGDDRVQITDAPVSLQQLRMLTSAAEENVVDLLLDEGLVLEDLEQAIDEIAKLGQLQHLRIRKCPVSDSQLNRMVAQLPALEILNLPHARLTASGFESLVGLPKLQQLRLGGGSIDDDCVARIAAIPKLKSLHLIGPRLTARSLNYLAKAPVLASFYLDDCPLEDAESEEAWNALFVAKPNLHVHVDQQHRDRDPNRHEHQ